MIAYHHRLALRVVRFLTIYAVVMTAAVLVLL